MYDIIKSMLIGFKIRTDDMQMDAFKEEKGRN